MLVSPTEPVPFRSLGKVSPLPERYGADFLILSPVMGTVGVQRKEIRDLVNSLGDGRVERELGQMAGLGQGAWIIEGEIHWTNDGIDITSQFTRAQFLGIVLSLQSRGLWVLLTSTLTETIAYLSLLEKWVAKERHTRLGVRPKARSVWGAAGSEETMVHIMQGFPGVGLERAKKIVEKYHRLPFMMDPTVDLTSVEGVGEGTVEKIMRMLG